MKTVVYFLFFFLTCNPLIAFATTDEAVDVSQSLKLAFAYSPSLQKTQEVRQRAEYDVQHAKSGHYPTIGVWAGIGITRESTEGTRLSGTDKDLQGSSNAGLTFSQPLWQGGATSSMVRSSKASLNSSIFTILDSATALAYNTVSAHADLFRRQALIKLSQNNINEHKKILELLNIRFSSGLSSKGDVEQVVSRLNKAIVTNLTYQEGLDAARINYLRLTGQNAPRNIIPVPAPTRTYASAKSVQDSCALYNYRLQALLSQIDALVAEKDATHASFFPHFSIDAGPSYINTESDNDTHELTWSAMLNMQWDLFNGGADLANANSSATRIREARKGLHETIDTLNSEIDLAFNRTKTAQEQTGYLLRASRASRIAKNNFFIQFEVGQKDLLSVLDAESESFAAESEAVVTQIDSIIGQYRMHALAGTLLATVGIDSVSISKEIPKQTTFDTLNIIPLTLAP